MIFSIMAFSITALSIMTFNITTEQIKCDTQHNDNQHSIQSRYAECLGALYHSVSQNPTRDKDTLRFLALPTNIGLSSICVV